VASNQSGETLDCDFKQADGSRQYLAQTFFLSGLLLPSACFSPVIFSKHDQNRFPEAKE
jgi:hypothetical protein